MAEDQPDHPRRQHDQEHAGRAELPFESLDRQGPHVAAHPHRMARLHLGTELLYQTCRYRNDEREPEQAHALLGDGRRRKRSTTAPQAARRTRYADHPTVMKRTCASVAPTGPHGLAVGSLAGRTDVPGGSAGSYPSRLIAKKMEARRRVDAGAYRVRRCRSSIDPPRRESRTQARRVTPPGGLLATSDSSYWDRPGPPGAFRNPPRVRAVRGSDETILRVGSGRPCHLPLPRWARSSACCPTGRGRSCPG